MWRNNPSFKQIFTDKSQKWDVSLQKRYRYLVNDYDPKQYVKKKFLKTSCFFFFNTLKILGRSQWCN